MKPIRRWCLKYNGYVYTNRTWRIVKDWVEAQLALIEAGQAELAEVFLPYAVLNTGETMYQRIANKPQILIGM